MKLTTFFFALCMTVPVLAQDAHKFFRLDFVIREFDDNKPVSAKTYSVISSTDEKARASIRTGNKVPYQVGPNSTQYADVGVNIDVYRIVETSGQLAVTISADVTTIPTQNESQNTLGPHIRQNKWNSTVFMPSSKPTLLFSSDDLNSKRKLQLELTATPMK